MPGAALVMVALLGLPVAAQETLTPDEFKAFASGRTLTIVESAAPLACAASGTP